MITKAEKCEVKEAQLTQNERRTYQALRARGHSHDSALNDALDGVEVESLRHKPNEEMRHSSACRFSGRTLSEVHLNHEHCICDPHGTKARQMNVLIEKQKRRDVLQQDEVWYPRDGDPIRLEDMSLRWKKNLIAFLEKRVRTLHEAHLIVMVSVGRELRGEHAIDGFNAAFDAVLDQQPIAWLYDTPFVRKLEHLISIEQDGPIDRQAKPQHYRGFSLARR